MQFVRKSGYQAVRELIVTGDSNELDSVSGTVSSPQKVLFVFGTRPEAIKLSPVIRQLQSSPDCFTVRVCVTGQHRSMLDQILSVFQIRPDYDLNIMQPGQDLFHITSACLDSLGPVLREEQPDWVLVQGDTTSAFAAALGAAYSKIRVGHVEAGLRTGDKSQPFPEEINRRLIAGVADLHFAPTSRAQRNLMEEGIPAETIHLTGNTGIDAILYAAKRIGADRCNTDGLEELDPARKLILVTGHRRENFGVGFQGICEALRRIAARDDVNLVYPVHLNPNVQQPVRRVLGGLPNVFLTPPLNYIPFIQLMQRAHIILTDSGGIQEEAPSLGKPVLVLREVTERPEAIEAGTAKLVGINPERIVAEVNRLLDDPGEYRRCSEVHNPYGDGHASSRIAQILQNVAASRRIG